MIPVLGGGGSCICVGTNINIGGVIKIVVVVSAEEVAQLAVILVVAVI